jgi:hypothetical protein
VGRGYSKAVNYDFYSGAISVNPINVYVRCLHHLLMDALELFEQHCRALLPHSGSKRHTHHLVQNQRQTTHQRMGTTALGYVIVHRSNLNFGLEHLTPRVTLVVQSLEPRTIGAAMKEISGALRTTIVRVRQAHLQWMTPVSQDRVHVIDHPHHAQRLRNSQIFNQAHPPDAQPMLKASW